MLPGLDEIRLLPPAKDPLASRWVQRGDIQHMAISIRDGAVVRKADWWARRDTVTEEPQSC